MEEEELVRGAQAISLILRLLAVAALLGLCFWLWRHFA
jgi:hypothetical protein